MSRDRSFSERNFYDGMFSFLCHLVVFFMFVPVLKNNPSLRTQTQFIFLGNILSDGDLMPASVVPAADASNTKRVVSLDFSKSSAPQKIHSETVKPNAAMPSPEKEPKRVAPAVVPPQTPDNSSIVFGFADFDQYVYEADFSDLKKAASRDELAAIAEFKITFDENGRVAWVRKNTGSGDPALDLALMYKLKKSIFRKKWIPAQRPLSVRIRLKE